MSTRTEVAAVRDKSPLAGRTVKIKPDVGGIISPSLGGQPFDVEDWWENVSGKSWMVCDGNPACLTYALRGAVEGLPIDNDVLYGKVGGFGVLLHVSELVVEGA